MPAADRIMPAARLACRTLLACAQCRLPVDPLPMLRAIPDVAVLEWDAACRYLQERGVSRDSLMAYSGTLGAVQFAPSQPHQPRIIMVLPDQTPARHRFTLAHELGHIILEHEGESDAADEEANLFASHLLVPRPLLRHDAKPGSRLTLRQLCLLYGVQPQVMQEALADKAPVPREMARQLLRQYRPGACGE